MSNNLISFADNKEIIKNISSNVWLAWQFKKGAAYIIKIKDGAILIDSTCDHKSEIVIQALKQLNLHPKDVNLIFNTHYHFEQIAGNLAFHEARIYAHKNEIPFINGEKKGNQKVTFRNFFSSPHTKKIINDLVDNTKLTFMDFSLFVVHTPGHTDGSTSYLYNNFLFVGDLIMYKEGKLIASQTGNINQIQNSIQKIKSLNFEFLCLGDGHIFSDGKNLIYNL